MRFQLYVIKNKQNLIVNMVFIMIYNTENLSISIKNQIYLYSVSSTEKLTLKIQ